MIMKKGFDMLKKVCAMVLIAVLCLDLMPASTLAGTEKSSENVSIEETVDFSADENTDDIMTSEDENIDDDIIISEGENNDDDIIISEEGNIESQPVYYATGNAHISSFSVSAQTDGMEPWDSDDSAGNDSNASNDIVRTFDYVNYTLSYTTALNDPSVSVNSGKVYVEFVLPCGPDVASFNLNTFNWMEDQLITYYLSDGTSTTEYTNGSEVVKQVVTGYRVLENTVGNTVIPGNGTLSVGIYIGAAKNGTTLTPSFTAWMGGNAEDDKVTIAEGSEEKQVHTLTVSAAQKYAIQIKQASNFDRSGIFDLSTGNENAAKDTISNLNSVSGRLEDYGITLIVQNDTVEKGLKGLEFPENETISFDLTLNESVYGSDGKIIESIPANSLNWTPVIWEYDENAENRVTGSTQTGNWGRSLFYYSWATGAAPANKVGQTEYNTVYDSCYDGGNWTIKQDSENPLIYHVTINNYTIDYKDYNFPTANMGSGVKATTPGSDYSENQACLTSGNLQCIIQYPEQSEIAENASIHFELTADNLTVGDTLYSDVTRTLTGNYAVMPTGSITGGVWFGYVNNSSQSDVSGPDKGVLGTSYKAGDGYSYIGNEIRLNQRVNITSDRDIHVMIGFAKWDADAFEVTGSKVPLINRSSSDSDQINYYTVYYAGLKENWGSVQEMSDTLMNDKNLHYFSNVSSLEAEGYVCVGALWVLDVDWVESTYSQIGFTLTVKDTANIGSVYASVGEGWGSYSTMNELEDIYGTLITSDGTINANWIRYGYDFYFAYCSKNVYPNMGKSNSSDRYYHATEYDEAGNIIAGTNVTAYNGGASLLICGEQSGVEISTDRTSYDMDYGQRTSVVTVKPSVTIVGNSSYTGEGSTTTATVHVTLPADLEYDSGTAYWGDTAITPDIVVNDDGSSVLTFTLENIKVGTAIDALTFNCTIGHAGTSDNVYNNESVTLTAGIESTYDHRVKSESFGNVSSTSFNIIRLSSTSISKSVDNYIIETGGSFTWTLNFYNGGSSDETNTELADVFPKNNDSNQSIFSGSYSITEIDIDFSKAPNTYAQDLASLDFWVSNSYDGTVDDLVMNGVPDHWYDLMLAEKRNGSDSLIVALDTSGYEDMAAFYFDLGEMDAGETVTIHIKVETEDNEPGDVYRNVFCEASSGQTTDVKSNLVSTQVVERNISGRTWIDANENGIQDSDEAPLSGVTVTLYKSDDAGSAEGDSNSEALAEDVFGDTVEPVKTAEDGTYSFTNLASGNYRVEFSDVDGFIYGVTESDVGTDDQIDSDAKLVSNESYNLVADINNINLPEIEDMDRYLYESSNNDAGYYYKVIENVNLTATKEYAGADLKEGQFDFTITETTQGATYSGSGTNDADGNIIFIPEIVYTFADMGTHTYVVAETEGTAEGVTYDTNPVDVTVVVSYDNGTVSTTVSVGDKTITAGDDGSYNVGTFKNTYEATGSVTLSATKEYTGAKLTDNLFEFKITETTEGLEEGKLYSDTAKNDADGKIIFPAINYKIDDVGTHTYEISETAGTAGGVTYDPETITVSVEVTDNGDGTLSTKVTVNGSEIPAGTDGSYNAGTFLNSYEAKGDVTLSATKTISGMNSTVKTFEFALYVSDENFTYNDGDTCATASTAGTLTEGESQIVTFPVITYTEAGEYYFVIAESDTGVEGDGWTYDDTEYHVTVVMTDDGRGNLVSTVTYAYVDENGNTQTTNSADFTNTYKAAETSVRFAGTKYISNSNSTDKVFAFELYETEDNFDMAAVMPEEVKTRGSIDVSGQSFEFSEITYEEVGTHYYVIKEQELDEADGWTISETVYYITVGITDNLAGQLVASVSYVTDTGGNSTPVIGSEDIYEGFDFTNTYSAADSVELTAVKSLNGRATSDKTFTFALYSSDKNFAGGTFIEAKSTDGTIEASQQVNFTEIEYKYDSKNTYPMNYYYIIREMTTDGSGWACDTGEYHVTVEVTDDGKGNLTTEPSYVYVDEDENFVSEDNATFKNTYAATGMLNLTGKKTLEGGLITSRQFTYTVMEGESMVSTGTVDADGTITFTQINYTYSDVGEHTYIITENKGNDSSVRYDPTVYTVVATVTDYETGKLDVSYTVNGEESGSIEFTNYQLGSLTISKIFSGLTDEQAANLEDFTITVKNSGDETVATLTMEDADKGSSYTWTVCDLVADTYTVTESGYSLDGYEVIAKSGSSEVTNGSEVSVSDILDWGDEDTVKFTNDYTRVGSLSVTKHVVEGTDASHLDVGYTVVITADKDAVDFQWVTVRNSTGSIIVYTVVDPKTISFTITNGQTLTVSGLPEGNYTVEERVSEDDDFVPVYRVGSLEKETAPTVYVASVDEKLEKEIVETVEIDNEYPIGTYIQVKKNYNNTIYPEGSDAFTYTIEALSYDLEAEGAEIGIMPMPDNASVTISSDNAVPFGMMTFEHLGTYYYKITETKGNLDYINYDSSVCYVKVTVSFDENAKEDYYLESVVESYCKCEEETDDYSKLEYTEADTIVTAEFTNTYSAKGSLTFTATKEYTGAELTDNLFEFTIIETTAGSSYAGTGTMDADGNITFVPEITYVLNTEASDVGTHIYEIRETAGNVSGITYDTHPIIVTVEVEDEGDGALYTSVMVDGNEVAEENGSYNAGTFKNSYQATGSVTFGGEKTISGKEAEENQKFTFALYTTDSSFNVGENADATDTQTVTGAGSFMFETISYNSDIKGNGEGTYYYAVKETSASENGWTKDETEYHITVDVRDNSDGIFILTVKAVDDEGKTVNLTGSGVGGTYSFTGLDFSNEYTAAPTSVQFLGEKYISNSTGTNKVFTFELYTTDDSYNIDGVTPEQKSTIGEITGSGQEFSFDEIKYTEPGTYHYVMKEQELDRAEGWTIDPKVYDITVEVEDNGIGQLVATVAKDDGTDTVPVAGSDGVYGGFGFVNEYEAEGNVTLGVVKSVSGVASTDEKFEFTLYESDGSFSVGNEIETITGEGEISYNTELNFKSIPFSAETAGTYYYIIKETGTAHDGWTTDKKEYHVTVTATDNGDGTITTIANYAYADENGETKNENAAEFTNTYAASGSLSLSGTKTFTGGTLDADAFTFTMTDSAGKSIGTVTMDAGGNITFPTLIYNETDIGKEYTYFIKETGTGDSSIVYDDNDYTVVVSVADNRDGTLAVTYTVDGVENGEITFANYQKGSLTIRKTFTGLSEEQIENLTDFTITVADSSGVTVTTLMIPDARNSNTTENNNISYVWTVNDLPAGIYTIKETGYSLYGYEVVAKSGDITVTDGSGVTVKDTLAWGGKDTVEFTNDYTEIGSVKITKYVIAEADVQKAHEDTEYTVVITADKTDEENADFQWVTVSSSSGREIKPVFKDNTITFTITEYETVTITGLPAGEYTVEETGSDAETSESFVPVYRIDNESHEDAPTVTVGSGAENAVIVEIDNEYPIATYIQVEKDYNRNPYPNEGFTFTIEALSCDPETSDVSLTADEMPMPVSKSVTITRNGEVGNFGTITYNHLGTYYYRITETAGSNSGITYDKSVHYIKVVVKEDNSHVESVVEYEYIADSETDDYEDLDYREAESIITAEFKNTYSADGTLKLSATKAYTGADLTDELFTFTITETTDPKAEDPYTETATNDAKGNVAFSPITYVYDGDSDISDVGIHTYLISEVQGSAEGVTYDGRTITVTVNVIDNGNGTLVPAVTIDGKGLTSGSGGTYNVGTFENHYQATGSVTFGGTKKLEGRENTYQNFNFALYTTDDTFEIEEDAAALDTQSLTGSGEFTFKTIAYDSDTSDGAGTYYYVVKETSVDENGWTMDTTEYHLRVDVTDAGDGTFTLEVSCLDADGETVSLTGGGKDGLYSFTGLDFTNSYKAAPASVQFTGEKYITNSLGTEKTFTFELYQADDETYDVEGKAAIQTVKTDGTITSEGQKIRFEPIEYDEPGTWYYVMKEQSLDEAEGWTIDDMVYYIIVEIKDDGLGQLVSTVTADDVAVAGTDGVYGGFDFDNGYTASGEVILGVVKSIEGVAGTDEEFEFTLYHSDEDFVIGDEIETITTEGTIRNSTELNFNAIPYVHDSSQEYPMYDYYVIRETGTAPDGWTLDDKEYHVTVTVEDDGTGTLTTASYIYTDHNGEPHKVNDAHFVNIYSASGELSLTGTKNLTGGRLESDKFAFTMEDSAGASIGTVTMAADGTITFPTLTFDETDIGKEYTYFITETDTGDSSVVYDDQVYKAVVSVADSMDGTLDVTYTVNGTENGNITFTNYQKGSLTVRKDFTGLSQDQIESLTDFTITVMNTAGETVAVLTPEDAEQNGAGNYIWTVKDLLADTYTVTESGYSLDGYEVIAKSGDVTVTDGTEVSVQDVLAWGGEDTVAFTNDYTGVGNLNITKYLIAGEDVQSAHEGTEYTVVVTADTDTDYQWVEVTGSSGREITPEIEGRMITFTIMEYESITVNGLPAGGYTLEETVSDADPSDSFVPVYRTGDDETEEAPHVTVESGDENTVSVEIDNVYPASADIRVQKNYNKDVYPEEGFTFTIEALSFVPEAGGITITADEMPMPENNTVTLTDIGDAGSFGGMTFEHLGTYYYMITETAGSENNILYDDSVHYIKVAATSDAATHLETVTEWESVAGSGIADYEDLEYTEAEDGIVTAEFTNTFMEELTIEKEVAGNSDTGEYEFEISLTSSDGTPFEGEVPVTYGEKEAKGISGWFSGIIRAFSGSENTVTFENGKAAVTVKAGEKITVMVPSGSECTITEKTTGSNSTIVYDSNGDVISSSKGATVETGVYIGTIKDSTLVKFVNSYNSYFPIDEEIVTDTDDIFNKDAWVKDEAVSEYNAIEIEMTTNLPVVSGYDLENGEFTMNFHEVLDSELVLDGADSDFSVYIGGEKISHDYYVVTVASENSGVSPADIRTFAGSDTIEDGCTFHVDVNLSALYRDGVVTEDMLDGNTELTIFFFADLEGSGLNGSYRSTIWYDIYDGDEWLYTSEESVVEVYTFEIEMLKYDTAQLEGNDYSAAALEGATLGLYYDKDCTDPVMRNGGPYEGVSGEDGYAIFYGLADGTYYVKETEAPDGYVLSDEISEVVIGEKNKVKDEEGNTVTYPYYGVFANTPEFPENDADTEKDERSGGSGGSGSAEGGVSPEAPGTDKTTGDGSPADSADTSDETPVLLMAVLMILAAFGLLALGANYRRHGHEGEK